MDNSNVTFTSKINFVSYRNFKKVIQPEDINLNSCIYALGEKVCVNTDLFRTEKVRTCTAGGLRSKNGRFSGFHIFDSESNRDNIKKIYKIMTRNFGYDVERALLIGSKYFGDFESYKSVAIFKKLNNILQNAGKKVTAFQTYTNNSAQSNLHYNAATDTWTINTQVLNYVTGKYNSILTKKDLKKIFKNISIADGDTLYINGKEIKSI